MQTNKANIIDNDFIKAINIQAKNKRKHASDWNWYGNKRVKEFWIVDSFLDSNNHRGIHSYIRFSLFESDPPDALIYNADGDEVSLEIVELVNRDAIDSQIQDKPDYLEQCAKWADLNYFESHLNKLIMNKNGKCRNLFNQKRDVQLLIHTDEMWIEACYKEHFDAGITINEQNFTKIWLMLGYSTAIKAYPIIQIC